LAGAVQVTTTRPRKELRHAPTAWDQTAVHDYEEAVDALQSRAYLYKNSQGLQDTVAEALDEMDKSIKAGNAHSIEKNWDAFLPAMKEMIAVTHDISESHSTVERGLTFTCKAYKLRAREAEKINRMHLGMMTRSIYVHFKLMDKLFFSFGKDWCGHLQDLER
jgi:hypothetical protein